MSEQPWHELPPEIASVLRPFIDEVADEIIAAVRTVPAYARPLEGPFGEGIRAGVQEALHNFLAEIEASGPVTRRDVYRALGRGEMRAGRTLESLLSAYRVGARVAWRRFAAIGVEAGLAPDTLYLLAESIFAYIDVLSAESAEGHALERSAAASEAELRRRRLVRALVREPAVDPELLEALAAEAGWPLPRALAVMAIDGPGRDRAVTRLPPDAIADGVGELLCAIVPDPDAPGRRAELQRAVLDAGAQAGLGLTVGWSETAASFAWARAALALSRRAPEFRAARDCAGELLLAADPVLAGRLAGDRLAPLDELSPASRERLTATLAAWLAHQGRLGPVAAALGIHPQTARYRLGRLRDVFGERLDDPEERFWLAVAVRIRRDG
ncbi:MAG TPA: helix-turn-helix domain-containing protein [Solirubrobacteraceae bacterium]|nr:helix-turn-helix domain-containing protein [Solirubrobacteraceae bacterium]